MFVCSLPSCMTGEGQPESWGKSHSSKGRRRSKERTCQRAAVRMLSDGRIAANVHEYDGELERLSSSG